MFFKGREFFFISEKDVIFYAGISTVQVASASQNRVIRDVEPFFCMAASCKLTYQHQRKFRRLRYARSIACDRCSEWVDVPAHKQLLLCN